MSLLNLLYHNQGKGRPIGGTKAIPWYLAGGVAAANCVAAYKAIGAADIATSYINVANPGTYDLSGGVAPTFNAATGWTFVENAYKSTGITPDDARNWSMIARFSNCANDTGYLMGAFNGATGYFMMTPRRAGVRKYYNGTTVANAAAPSTAGVICIAGNKGYIDGVEDATITTASLTLAAIWIGGPAEGGALVWKGNIQTAAIYNTILTVPQIAAIGTAMAALA